MRLSLADRPIHESPKKTRGRALLISALTSALILTPAPAMAEGGFDSNLSGVRTGFISRQWTDHNNDGASTTTQVSGCSRSDGANFLLEVELRKRRSFLPDVSYGRKNFSSCTSGAPTGNWGNPGSGDFFDQFWHYDFGTVSASSVKVRY